MNAKALSSAARFAIQEPATDANGTSNDRNFRPSQDGKTSGTQDTALILLGAEAVLALAYVVYTRILRKSRTVRRPPNATFTEQGPIAPAGILIDRMADRLDLDRNTGDTASLSTVGFGSTLKRETSAGRNRRRGTSGSGHNLVREVYT